MNQINTEKELKSEVKNLLNVSRNKMKTYMISKIEPESKIGRVKFNGIIGAIEDLVEGDYQNKLSKIDDVVREYIESKNSNYQVTDIATIMNIK